MARSQLFSLDEVLRRKDISNIGLLFHYKYAAHASVFLEPRRYLDSTIIAAVQNEHGYFVAVYDVKQIYHKIIKWKQDKSQHEEAQRRLREHYENLRRTAEKDKEQFAEENI